MKTELTSQDVELYQREGWLIIEDFLTPDELGELCSAIDAAVTQMGATRIADGGASNQSQVIETDSYYNRVFLQRVNLWKINDTIRKYFQSPDLGKLLCKLAGVDGIRVWHDQTLQKRAWDNPTSWHIDDPNWSFYSPDAISIWIALDDATIQNGCMYYLPGTHKLTDYEKKGHFGPNMGALFDEYPEFKEIEPVAAEMKAGSAGFHNGLTAHAAGPNMTPYPRRAMTCIYMPEGSTYNGRQNVLSDEQVDSLEIGDVLDDESQTPLVWSNRSAANSL